MTEDSSNNNEQTVFDRADHEFAILITMLDQLPEGVRKPLLEQAGKARVAQKKAHVTFLKLLADKLGDVRLDVLAQKFDLDMTKREKQELQDKLDNK